MKNLRLKFILIAFGIMLLMPLLINTIIYHPSYIIYGADDAPYSKFSTTRFIDEMSLNNNGNANGIAVFFPDNVTHCHLDLYGKVFKDSSFSGGIDNIEPYGADTKKLVIWANHGGAECIGNEFNTQTLGELRLGNNGSNDCNWLISFGCSTTGVAPQYPGMDYTRFYKVFQGLHGICGYGSTVIGTGWGGDPYGSTDLEFLGSRYAYYLYQGNSYYNSFSLATHSVLIWGNYGGHGLGASPGIDVKAVVNGQTGYDYYNETIIQTELTDTLPQYLIIAGYVYGNPVY